MGEDEVGTLAALKAHRKELLVPKETQYHGRTINLMGDGVLMEFGSVVDAVAFAVEVQVAMQERNASVPADRRIIYRVGINIGDVIVDSDDIHGDGVNVAARLETLADAGGIAVSGTVLEHIGNKLDLEFEDLGERKLKNIAKPVHLYRVKLDTSKVSPETLLSESMPLPDKPVIAVLSFENLSEAARWERFAAGLSDDIITDLTRYPDLLVIARNSTFAYKGRAVDVRQIGRELKAGYVLEGSIQTVGKRIRVTAQLIDTQDGSHVWAERYDRNAGDLFAIQDDVVEHVAAALGGFHGEILRAERGKLRRRPPESLRAYELYLLGYELEAPIDKENTLEAIQVLERAIEMDPLFARTWTVLGWACEHAVTAGWAENPSIMAARRRTAVLKAAELDPRDPIALEELGALRAEEGDIGGAREAFERALELGRNHADTLALLAKYVVTVLGRENEAMSLMKRAFRLNPNAPNWYFMNQLRVAYFTRDFETAVHAAKRSTDFCLTHLFNILALAQLGRTEEVAGTVADFWDRYPDFDPESIIRDFPLIDPSAIELYRDGLRKAGFSK
jgi:TolB-like protein/Flp pilus assembly protein TadD